MIVHEIHHNLKLRNFLPIYQCNPDNRQSLDSAVSDKIVPFESLLLSTKLFPQNNFLCLYTLGSVEIVPLLTIFIYLLADLIECDLDKANNMYVVKSCKNIWNVESDRLQTEQPPGPDRRRQLAASQRPSISNEAEGTCAGEFLLVFLDLKCDCELFVNDYF